MTTIRRAWCAFRDELVATARVVGLTPAEIRATAYACGFTRKEYR